MRQFVLYFQFRLLRAPDWCIQFPAGAQNMSKHLPAGKKTRTGSWRGGSYDSFPHWSSMIICLLQVIFNYMLMSVCLEGLELWRRAIWRVFLRVKHSESLCLHFTQPLATRHLVYFSLIFHETIQRLFS